MNIIHVIVCLIIIAIMIKFIDKRKNKRLYQLLEQFPSYPTYPLIGNVHMLLGSLDGLLARGEKVVQPFDRLVYWLGPIPVLILNKHDDIAMVLTQSSDRDALGIGNQWLGIGIMNARYEEWKKSRKMLTSAFNSNMLSKYLEVFNEIALNLVQHLRSVADTNEEVDMSQWMMTASMNTIVENAMGIQIKKDRKLAEGFCEALHEAVKQLAVQVQWPVLIFHKVYAIYLKMTKKNKIIHQFQHLPTKLIEENLNKACNLQGLEDSPKTMLDLLIKKGFREFGFSKIRLRDELLQIFVTGTETSALALSFLTLMLAINQDIQQKVYEEITQLTADCLTITENHLNNGLTYLEQCIKETLRMYSPVVLNMRRTHKDIILNDNTIIPANMLVVPFYHIANYDTDLYKNPLKWDPEHFNEQATKERPKTSQFSFGYGPRNCIGAKYAMMSMKTFIIYILRNYHLSTTIKEFTKEDLKADLSIRSKIGYPIKFTTRGKKIMGEK